MVSIYLIRIVLFFLDINNDLINEIDIVQTQRIGISKAKDMPYRFYIKDNIFVSKK